MNELDVILLKSTIERVLLLSDWTQLPNNGLTLSEQIAQQEIRVAWMELDNSEIDQNNIVLPPYPMMERP